MAATHITLDISKRYGGELHALVHLVEQAKNGVAGIYSILIAMRDGTNYHQIGLEMGITDAEAEAAFLLVANAFSGFTTSDFANLLSNLG